MAIAAYFMSVICSAAAARAAALPSPRDRALAKFAPFAASSQFAIVSDPPKTTASCDFSAARNVALTRQDPFVNAPLDLTLLIVEPEKAKGDVVIVPPSGGVSPLEGRWARLLCKRGYRVTVAAQWSRREETLAEVAAGDGFNWQIHDQSSIRGVIATRAAIDYLGVSKIGLMGASRGAQTTAEVLALDDRVGAAVTIVGGTPVYQILATGEATGVAALNAIRDARLAKLAALPENRDIAKNRKALLANYEAKLKENVWIDPGYLADPAKSERLFALTATGDLTIPSEAQTNLVLAWHSPARLEVYLSGLNLLIGWFVGAKGNHVPAIIAAYRRYSDDVIAFFDSHL